MILALGIVSQKRLKGHLSFVEGGNISFGFLLCFVNKSLRAQPFSVLLLGNPAAAHPQCSDRDVSDGVQLFRLVQCDFQAGSIAFDDELRTWVSPAVLHLSL